MTDTHRSATVLPREFYLRDTRVVARDLIGREVVRLSPEGPISGVIVETEAYLGVSDRASHAYGGKKGKRTASMYEEGGRAYVFLIYGMYWCLNITTREAGVPEAVLIRALQPVTGVDLMRRRRLIAGKSLEPLTNGPGKLCIAMGIEGSMNGEDLCGDLLFVREGLAVSPEEVISTPRVNIDYAGAAVHHEWRYLLKGSPFVSRL